MDFAIFFDSIMGHTFTPSRGLLEALEVSVPALTTHSVGELPQL